MTYPDGFGRETFEYFHPDLVGRVVEIVISDMSGSELVTDAGMLISYAYNHEHDTVGWELNSKSPTYGINEIDLNYKRIEISYLTDL